MIDDRYVRGLYSFIHRNTRDFFLFDYIYSTFPRISKSLAHFKRLFPSNLAFLPWITLWNPHFVPI